MLNRHDQLFHQLANSTSAPLSSIEKGLLVMSTPRSGSTLFCDILSRTGKIGLCEEWFNLDYMRAYLRVLGKEDFDIREYLTFVAQKTVKDTGIFAVHAHAFQLMNQDKLGIRLSNMNIDFKVYIKRVDYCSQVVSMAVAEKSQQWRCDEEAKSVEITFEDCKEAQRELEINFQAYRDVYKRQMNAEYIYEKFQTPGHIVSFNEVLVALGKQPQDTFSTNLKKQRTKQTIQIANQFRDYLRKTT